MLTEFQRRILAHIARNRSPDSLVAGGAALNRRRARLSRDIDIFHEAVAQVQAAARKDLEVLRRLKFRTEMVPGFSLGRVQAVVRDGAGGEFTRLEWTVESAFRFFPAVEDPEFGWRLHDIDLAVNKVLALAGRQEPRDVVDIVALHAHGYPLAALAWAAPAKDPGFTPEFILDEVSRNSRIDPARLASEILTAETFDPVATKKTLLAAIHEARELFAKLPPDQMGCLYLDAELNMAMPDPEAVAAQHLHLHRARLRGAWPAIAARQG